MPFGKHKGALISNVPLSYLVWVIESCNPDQWLRVEILNSVADRLKLPKRRKQQKTPSCDRCDILLEEWGWVYSKLARVVHPDRFGDTSAMQILNDANDMFMSRR
jgi:hypothetical protein